MKMMIYCEADHECGPDHYCYHTGYCVECTDCHVYNRYQAEYPSCPKDPLECGSCLPGFEEEMLVEWKRRDICILMQMPEENVESFLNTSWCITFLILGLIVILLIVLIGIFLCFWKNRNKNCNRDVSSNRNFNVSEFHQDAPAEDINVIVTRLDSTAVSDVQPPPYECFSPSAPLLNVLENNNQAMSSSRIMNAFSEYHQDIPAGDRNVMSKGIDSRTPDVQPPPYDGHISPSAQLLHTSGEGQEGAVDVNEMQVCYKQGKEVNCLEGTEPFLRASHPYNNFSDDDDDDDDVGGGGDHNHSEDEEEAGVLSGSLCPPDLDEEETVADAWSPPENYGNMETTLNIATDYDQSDNKHNPHESGLKEVNNPVNDSGISDSSCQTSSSSLVRPFAHLNSSGDIPSMQEACSRGITRSHSDDDLPIIAATKRQRHDSGTLSLGDASSGN